MEAALGMSEEEVEEAHATHFVRALAKELIMRRNQARDITIASAAGGGKKGFVAGYAGMSKAYAEVLRLMGVPDGV